MRISDWSSDVCSSDRPPCRTTCSPARRPRGPPWNGLSWHSFPRHGHRLALAQAPAPQAPLADHELDQRDGRHHDQDEHGRIRDGEAVVAILDPADDVGRGHVVVGADEEDDGADRRRSEEHTSELQSLMRISYAVFCLKNKKPLTNT